MAHVIYGHWAFKVADWETPEEIIWAQGTLAQCKRQILHRVKPAKGARIVAFVQP